MPSSALREDVISALREANGVHIEIMNDGSVEVSAVSQPPRRFPFKATVPRRLLWKFVGWYNVPIEAFFKSYRVHPKSNAAGK